jgi:hypothetical protein
MKNISLRVFKPQRVVIEELFEGQPILEGNRPLSLVGNTFKSLPKHELIKMVHHLFIVIFSALTL